MRTGNGLRGNITCVPMILVPRMQDASQIRLNRRANQRGTVHHRGDLLKPLANLKTTHRRVDRGKSAQHIFDGEPHSKRLIVFRIERIRSGHAATHPDQDASVGRCPRVDGIEIHLSTKLARSGRRQSSRRCSRHGPQKITPQNTFGNT